MSLELIYRQEYGRILASLIRVVRDFSLAEDALQEAFATAQARWAGQTPPANAVAWLMVTARNKAIDQIRHRVMAQNKHEEMITLATPEESAPQPADTLRLIFTCCHPSLNREAQVALTLHTVCGLTTEQIARAFLVPTPTLAQRIVRAKTKIRVARIPYEVPEENQLSERLETVLAVIYLVFNEGYAASFGDEIIRRELCSDAISLARQLIALLPHDREPRALLALMLLTDARQPARTNASGDLILLEEQDRSLWNREKIDEGIRCIEEVLRRGPAGSYAVQAAIAALHARASRAEETDWPQIAALYGVLAKLHPSPVIELNRAVAIAMAEGPDQGLALLNNLALPNYHLLPAARADLLRRLGRREEAIRAYHDALELVGNAPERRFLERRLQELARP